MLQTIVRFLSLGLVISSNDEGFEILVQFSPAPFVRPARNTGFQRMSNSHLPFVCMYVKGCQCKWSLFSTPHPTVQVTLPCQRWDYESFAKYDRRLCFLEGFHQNINWPWPCFVSAEHLKCRPGVWRDLLKQCNSGLCVLVNGRGIGD